MACPPPVRLRPDGKRVLGARISHFTTSAQAKVMFHPVRWSSTHVCGTALQKITITPRIAKTDVVAVAADMDVWDAWPVQQADGNPHRLAHGDELWMALGAPKFSDPDERHGHARIHLVLRSVDSWRHLGQAMPEGFSPGSREWSGSAVIDATGTVVTLYFTAAGRKDEASVSFEQRIFSAQASLTYAENTPRLTDWRSLEEIVVRDPEHYMSTTEGQSGVGKIKAFRDPAYFRDPADSKEYLLFAGSCAQSASDYNGVVGIARRDMASTGIWQILPPLISADGLNNELERPHVVWHDGLYYLFWSTQRHVFDPSGVTGPTGLYGMVSHSLLSDWKPLNGTGLVFANPEEAPAQAYSWFVLPDLSVTSFVDDWDGSQKRSFGGTFAPFITLSLQDQSARIA